MTARTVAIAACCATLVAGSATLAACSGKERSTKSGPAANAKQQPATGVIARLPVDASMLASFNFEQLRGTAMYKNSPGVFQGIAKQSLDTSVAQCDIDVFAQLDRVTVARGAGDSPALYIAVEGSLIKDRLETCVSKSSDIAATTKGGITTYTSEALDKPLHVSWVTPTTMLIVDDRTALATLLDKGVGPGPSAANAALMKKIDTGASAWAVGRVPANLPLGMLGIPAAPTVFWAHAVYGDGAKLKVGARFDTADGAKGLERVVRAAMKGGPMMPPVVVDALNTMKVTRSGTDLEVRATMTSKQIESISGLAGSR